MSRDGPSAGRFGFQQAAAAGAPYRAPRSNSQLNLENLVKRRPELAQKVADLKALGKRANDILYILRDLEGLDGRYSIDCWRDKDFDDLARTGYSDDREQLVDEVEFSMEYGLYKWACLYKFDPDKGDWDIEKWWPNEPEDLDEANYDGIGG